MDFVAGTVEEARVDEADALRGILDAGLEVHRGAALLVHDADLHSVGGHRQYLLDAAEDIDRERDLIRAVHLRLDDVDRALAAVLQLGLALQVVEREQAGDGGIEDAFRNFLTRAVEYSVGEHVMADVADQHHAAAVQGHLALLVRCGVGAVGIERAGQCLAALLEVGRQRAVH